MNDLVQRFRGFNRAYTRVLGLLDARLLGMDLSLAQARVLFEVRAQPGVSAAQLTRLLIMDRGQMSRIVKSLERKGFLRKDGLPAGRRPVALHATQAGLAYLADLDRHADAQAKGLLAHLSRPETVRLIAALDQVESLLTPGKATKDQVLIRPAGASDPAWIIDRHMAYYGKEYDFGPEFETYLVSGMAGFLQSRSRRSQVWIAELGGLRAGSVGIVDAGENKAQLRWLLVEPWAQGQGAGKALVSGAVSHCRATGFDSMFLWTFSLLLPARALYKSQGFELAEEKNGSLGGRDVVEELWVRDLKRPGASKPPHS